MADTNFISGTVITSEWLNDANAIAYKSFANIKRFGGTGSGNETSIIQAAINDAFSNNIPVLWEDNYTVTSNITNFHNVKHIGKGAIIRGSDTWTIGGNEGTTYNLYVSASGNDLNDGLSASFPLRTIQRAVNIIKDNAPLTGRYTIQLAAGTYTENITVSSMTVSDFPIDIRGPNVGGGTPTAIITAAVTSGDILNVSVGGWFRCFDVQFTGATTGTAIVVNRSLLSLSNVRVSGCLNGVSLLHGAQLNTSSGCVFTGRGKTVVGGRGYSTFYNTTQALSGNTIFEQWERGILLNEGVQGHLDDTIVQDCGTGVEIKRGAGACNTTGMIIRRNDIGIDAQNQWFNNNITFGTGVDSNVINVRTSGGSPELVARTVDAISKTSRQQISTNITAHTGTTTETTIWSWAGIKPWMISEAGDTCDLFLSFSSAAPLAGTFRVRLSIWDGTTDDLLADVTFPVGSTTFSVNAKLFFSEVNAQRCHISGSHSVVGSAQLEAYGTGALNLKNLTGTLRLKYTLTNAADAVTTNILTFNTTVGG